jgi:methylated-DNA-[protein]-cysteine S-methyltransferase
MPQLSLHSPLGDLTVSEEDGAIVSVDWGRGPMQTPTPLLREAAAQVQQRLDSQLRKQ